MSTLCQNNQNQVGGLKASAPTNTDATSVIGFKGGLSISTTAILSLIEALMEISDMKNDLFTEQVTEETQMAQDYSKGQKNLGAQEMFDYIGQAVSGFTGGALNLTMGAMGVMEKSELKPLHDEMTGANNYKKLLDNPRTKDVSINETDTQGEAEGLGRSAQNEDLIQKRINEMKDREKFTTGEGKTRKPVEPSRGRGTSGNLTDEDVISVLKADELEELRTAYKEKIDKISRNMQAKQTELRTRFDQRQMFGQGASSVAQSGSSMNTAVQKQLQGQQQANNTLAQSAQQIYGQVANETQKQSDQDYNQAIDLTQVIIAIDNTNRMNNG